MCLPFLSLTCCEVAMAEMVCQEETVRREREDLRENRESEENVDRQDLGVLESLTSGGERAPAPTLLELSWSTLEGLVLVNMTNQEEQQRGCACPLTLTT